MEFHTITVEACLCLLLQLKPGVTGVTENERQKITTSHIMLDNNQKLGASVTVSVYHKCLVVIIKKSESNLDTTTSLRPQTV